MKLHQIPQPHDSDLDKMLAYLSDNWAGSFEFYIDEELNTIMERGQHSEWHETNIVYWREHMQKLGLL